MGEGTLYGHDVYRLFGAIRARIIRCYMDRPSYYFNFVQTEYFKEAEPAARVDAFAKLAPVRCGGFAGERWGHS